MEIEFEPKKKPQSQKTSPNTIETRSSKRLRASHSFSDNEESTSSSTSHISALTKRRKKLKIIDENTENPPSSRTMSSRKKSERKREKKFEISPEEVFESKSEEQKNEEKNPQESHFSDIQGLLSRLGTITQSFSPNPSLSKTRLNTLLEGLKAEGNEDIQLQCIMELCDFLSVGTEDSMSNFPIDGFVPPLVNLLKLEHNPDIMLMACRALAYLMEALPNSCGTVVSCNAVPLLISRLLSIEYIDLAEQALQCLEKLSYEHSVAVLKSGGLMACLSYLDFFPVGTQRLAISTAANACKQVQIENYEIIVEAIPILSNLVNSYDSKVSEKTIVCFTRLAECLYNDEKKIHSLTTHGLVHNLMNLISSSNPSSMNSSLYTQVVRLLALLCSGDPSLALDILKEGIASTLNDALTGSGKSENSSGSTIMSAEKLSEILSLINELLPHLPKDFCLYLEPNLRPNVQLTLMGYRTLARVSRKSKKKDLSNEEESDPRENILAENPQLLVNFGESLMYILFQVFTSTVNSPIRYKCLSAITKIIYFSTPKMLEDLLRNLTMSSFLASLLSSNDKSIVATALKIAENLMQKLPTIFEKYFKREGVVYEIEQLIQNSIDVEEPVKDKRASKQKDQQVPKVETFIQEHALKLKKNYFENSTDDNCSNELKQLKKLSEKLSSSTKPRLPDSSDKEILISISKILTSDIGVSTFEFMCSGIAKAILSYLTVSSEKLESEKTRDSKEMHILFERAKLFCTVFLNPENSTTSTIQPLSALVSKLHHSLNKEERFPVVIHGEISGTPSGLKYLTQPFKIKLKKGNDPSISEFSDSVVLVEPLANIRAIHEFLLPKVFSKDQNEKKEKETKIETEEEIDGENSDEVFAPEKVHDLYPSSSEEKQSEPDINKPSKPKLKFFINDKEIPSNVTIFQAFQESNTSSQSENSQLQPISKLWETVHTITYISHSGEENKSISHHDRQLQQTIPLFESRYTDFLNQSLQFNFECQESVHDVLMVFRLLYQLNTLWMIFYDDLPKSQKNKHIISPTDFINNKISSKLLRQLQDPFTLCSGALPLWCKEISTKSPYLFPFECRRLYFLCTSFGIARALHALQQNLQGANNNNRGTELRVGRIQRQKVRISRERIYESAVKVMELYGKTKAILEVEYFNEVGTGLGPTLEFYTLVSRELQLKDRNLWRDLKPEKKSKDTFVHNPGGLFPKLMKEEKSEESKQILNNFNFLGTFVAKALLDSRVLDLPLSTPFLKKMLGQPLTFRDLELVDFEYASSLEKLLKICEIKREIEKDLSLKTKERKSKLQELNESKVVDLELDFTLPGFPDWELKTNGKNISVTIYNLEEYISLILEINLLSGVKHQFEAFEKGFDQVFPIENLNIFSVEELERLIYGSDESKWEMQTLLENTRCDHGFSHNSPVVQFLLELMTEFNSEEQRKFLLFVTGSPRLPLGGFKSLEPKLTIVRKEQGKDSGESPDNYLPSVNCCFYYLKLPEYSSKQVLKEKLFFAMDHGQGHFSFN